MANYKVLSTKKLEPSLVGLAKEKDIEIIETEFISVKPLWSEEKFQAFHDFAFSEDQRMDHVVFTSSNAVKAMENYLYHGDTYYNPRWKIFCLSGKTREALVTSSAEMPGEIIDTASDARSLAVKIIEHGITEIVFFCGDQRRDELPFLLREAGVKVHEMIVYETLPTPAMVTAGFDAILFFSPSAVQSFFSVNEIKKNTTCFAIGQTTADAIADFTDNKLIVAGTPGQAAMLASLQFYFENKNCYDL